MIKYETLILSLNPIPFHYPDAHAEIEAGFARTEPMHQQCTLGTVYRNDELWRIGCGENGDNKSSTVIVSCGLRSIWV